MYNVLIITLGTHQQMGSSRLRIYNFLRFINKHNLCSDFKIKIITKPTVTKINFSELVSYGINIIRYYFELSCTLKKKWDIIECSQCYFSNRIAQTISKKTCLILDFTDLGSFDKKYVRDNCSKIKMLAWFYLKRRDSEYNNMISTCQHANLILSNSADSLPPFLIPFKNKFRTLTDPIDIDVYKPEKSNGPLVIGWTGSQRTAYLVNSIKDVLVKVKKKYGEKIEIRFHGSDDDTPFAPELRQISTIVKWSLEKSAEETRKIKVGLAPAFDDALARYKHPLKVLQYMSVGAVVIANPIGMAPYLIRENETGFLAKTDDEWFKYLCLLIENKDILEKISVSAREEAIKRFSYNSFTEQWHSHLLKARNQFENEMHL